MSEYKETWTDSYGTVWRKSDDSGIPITVTRMSDPAYLLMIDGVESEPEVYKRGCYICEDPEFAQMGLPLCRKCPACGGHIAADDTVCDECGLDEQAFMSVVRDRSLDYHDLNFCFSTGYPDYELKMPSLEEMSKANEALNRERK